MKGHETDAAAKLGMNDAAQLEHDQWRSKDDRLIDEKRGEYGGGMMTSAERSDGVKMMGGKV